MALAIDEVEVQTDAVQPAPAAPGPAPGPRRIDPDELRTLLRRQHDRAARLWVD